ncbi:MAG: hypothetical protein ABFC78_01685 [Methanoregula sp.]
MAEETHQEQPPRQHHERGSYHRPREHRNQPPHTEAEPQAQEPAGENIDAADTDEEREESQRRPHGGHRGGRPPKKVYEEFINDPYCE